MKPLLEKVTPQANCSFNAKIDILKFIDSPWHYHPEFELTYIIKSTGRRIIGDSIESFKAGDMVLSGPNLPHVWLNDKKYYQKKSKQKAEVFVLHFNNEWFYPAFFDIPEASAINNLLTKSERGLKIKEPLRMKIIDDLFKIKDSKGFDRVINFLTILNKISQSNEYEYLASETFWQIFPFPTNIKMSKIIQYIS